MKNAILKIVAKMAEKSIVKSNKTACFGLSYQPKAPKNIKNFRR